MFRRTISLSVLLVAAVHVPANAAKIVEADVCVYGGTSGGVVAAVQAARMGKSAVLVEPGKHLGGMTSGGLSAVDIGDPRSIGGITREYFTKLVGSYGKTLAWDKPFEGKGGPATGGAFAIEPHTAEKLFNDLARDAKVSVHFDARLASVRKEGVRIVEFATDDGTIYRAKVFIDATYEGDLMAKAGVSYTVQREGNAKYGETYNGIHYSPKFLPRLDHQKPGANGRVPDGQGVWDRDLPLDPFIVPGDPKSGLLPLIQAGEPGKEGDPAPGVQAYCYRLCLTTSDDRIPIKPPENYDAKRYELVVRFIEGCKKIGDDMDLRWFSKYDPLPNKKWDFNTAAFGGNLVGASWDWPEASYARRAEIAKEHENYHRGLLHFLATDPRVPEKVRTEIKRFGLPRDEFTDNGGWPHQLYIREARRMVSDLVLTEHHTFGKKVAPNSMSLGSYGTDTHEIRRIVKDGVVIREGKTATGRGGAPPYPIGYGAIVPKPNECDNLLVTYAVSSSHTAFSSIRMEPVFMATSQSAATAACLAIDEKVAIQKVDQQKLRERLLADKQVLEWSQVVPPKKKEPAKAVDDPAIQPPTINTSPGPEYADDKRMFQGIPGIERSAKGRLWALWYSGGVGEGAANYVVLVTSGDDGKTWSGPKLIIDPPDAVRAYDPCLWHDPQGRLWLFWAQSHNHWDGRSGVWAIVTENSNDDKPRWSQPKRLADGIMMNKPTMLSTGEWLLPVSIWERKGKTDAPYIHDLGKRSGANVVMSKDRGETWNEIGQALVPNRTFDEHMIVERRDGSLWMLVRATYGIGESVSIDKGKTWSEGKKSSIPHVNSRFFIRRLNSGKLLLVTHNSPDQKTRSHLTAHLSDDDGKTWKGSLLLDERTGVSYPDGVQAADGTIYIIYDFERTSQKQILMATFSEDDVANGKWSDSSRQRVVVNQATAKRPPPPKPNTSKIDWDKQAAEDAKLDRTSIAYDGKTPNKMVCDTTLRELPDGSWALFMLAGGDTEPSPKNYTGLTRSKDQGKTWTPLEAFDVGFPREGTTIGQGPTELMIRDKRCTLFFSTHSKHWSDNWRSWFIHSDDSGKTWTKPEEVPGRLKERTFIRNHIITRDGRIMLPFQHYIGPEADAKKPPLERAFTNPRNGVLISGDGGKTWSEHGNIRLTDNDRYFGWAENNIVELKDGCIAMIIRADKLGGVLYYAESKDGGKTWPEFAKKTDIPNPGSKATLYPLGGDAVAILHNPNPKHRSPMALWVSFDGMKSWPYRRVLIEESCDGPQGRMNYPDGFVSNDKQYLHFAFDDNRHRAVYVGAKLPPIP